MACVWPPPALPVLQLLPSCMHASATTPAEAVRCSCRSLPELPSAFPLLLEGRLPRNPFRGLLDIHCAFRPACSLNRLCDPLPVGSGPGAPVLRLRWLVRRFRSGPQSGCRNYVSRPRRVEPRHADFRHRALLLATSQSLCAVGVGALSACNTAPATGHTDPIGRTAFAYSTASIHSLIALWLASCGT